MNYNIDRTKQLTNLQYQTRREAVMEMLGHHAACSYEAARLLSRYQNELAELDGKYKARYDKQLDRDYKTMEEIERGTKTA